MSDRLGRFFQRVIAFSGGGCLILLLILVIIFINGRPRL